MSIQTAGHQQVSTGRDTSPVEQTTSRNGVMTSDHPYRRSLVSSIGAAMTAGGLASFGLMRTPLGAQTQSVSRNLQAAALGLAGAGVAVLFMGSRINASYTPYMAPVTDSRTGALELAARSDHDVALHKTDAGLYGLISLAGHDVDNNGPGDSRIGNIDIPWNALTTRDGDVWENINGSWHNRGATLGPKVELSTLDPSRASDLSQLRNAQLGTNSRHQALHVGARAGAENGYASAGAAGQALFEASSAPKAIVQMGARWYAFDTAGSGWSDDVKARGAAFAPFKGVSILAGSDLLTARTPGGSFEPADLPRVDVANLSAATLTGRRFGLTAGGGVIRLGAESGTFDTLKEAGEKSHGSGAQHAIIKVGNQFVTYRLEGGDLNSLATLLGPDDKIMLQRGKKIHRANGSDGLAFVQRATPFDVNEPIGNSVSVNGQGGTARRHVASYSSRESAVSALRNQRYPVSSMAIIESPNSRGRFHVYELGGSAGAAWDEDLGTAVATVMSHDDTRARSRTDRHSDGSSDTYSWNEQRHWSELHDRDRGTEIFGDTGWDRVGGERHTGHTNPPPPQSSGSGSGRGSGGSSGGGSSGGSSGSGRSGGGYGGGNTNPGSGGGGYGGGNTEPD